VDGKLQTATVELKQPSLNGTTLTFQARVLEGTPPTSGGTTSVFIDMSCVEFLGATDDLTAEVIATKRSQKETRDTPVLRDSASSLRLEPSENEMAFARLSGAWLLGVALMSNPAWADPPETAKAAGEMRPAANVCAGWPSYRRRRPGHSGHRQCRDRRRGLTRSGWAR